MNAAGAVTSVRDVVAAFVKNCVPRQLSRLQRPSSAGQLRLRLRGSTEQDDEAAVIWYWIEKVTRNL